MKNHSIILTLIASLFFAHSASADQIYTCAQADQERIITVVTDTLDALCQLKYTKDGNTQTMWHAENDANFCAEKAVAFVAQQESWGWDCSDAVEQ